MTYLAAGKRLIKHEPKLDKKREDILDAIVDRIPMNQVLQLVGINRRLQKDGRKLFETRNRTAHGKQATATHEEASFCIQSAKQILTALSV